MNRQRHHEWAEAKRRCRLTSEALQMAKELGMSPRGLLKNVPAKREQWKLPVEAWVRDLYRKRFGERAPLGAQPGAGGAPGPHVAAPADEAKPAAPARNFLREAEDALFSSTDEEVEPGTLAERWAALERDTPISEGEIAEENQENLWRQQRFRDVATAVARALSQVAAVQKVMLFGSVAASLEKEISPHRRLRRGGVEVWHQCKDVDLAVWIDDLTRLRELKRAAARALDDWQRGHPNSAGVAHHQVDIFLMEPHTNRFRGKLCHYGQCPKGKRECEVPGCGAQPFLQLYEGFRLYRDAVYAEHNIVLFERAAPSPAAEADDDIPF